MYKDFEDYEAEERLISLLKNSELRHKYKTRMERRRSNLNKARFLFVVLLLAILFTAAVMKFCLAVPEPNEPTEEKVVEDVAEGSAEVAAFESYIPSGADQIPAVSYAEFTVTHYCGCPICCGKWSSGSESEAYGCKGDKLVPYYSIAADPDVIPYGTIVYDQDGNEYKVVDTGSAIKGNKIDLFIGDHDKANELGIGTIYLYW